MDKKQFNRIEHFLGNDNSFYVIVKNVKNLPLNEKKKEAWDAIIALGEPHFMFINANVSSSKKLSFQNVPKDKKGNAILMKASVLSSIASEIGINLEARLYYGDIMWFPIEFISQKKTRNEITKKNRRVNKLRTGIINATKKTSPQLVEWTVKNKKELDNKSTKSELSMFKALQKTFKKRIESQQPFVINGKVYYADLCIKSLKTIIEVDGGYHNTEEQRLKDAKRDEAFKSIGYTTIRVTNEQALSKQGKQDVVAELLRKKQATKQNNAHIG
jgi:very-short-patch-repair endonuclease